MNQEMPMEKEFSSEANKIELIKSEVENFITEGDNQANSLSEIRLELMEKVKDEDELRNKQIFDKLVGSGVEIVEA